MRYNNVEVNMMKHQVEVFCGSYYDAKQAEYGGATCIALSHYQYQQGLTPSIGELLKVKENTSLEVICILRPRLSGYYYNDEDIETMFLDAEVLLDNGADGIAFGFLDIDRDINISQTRKMIELIHSYHKKAIFNQAIDYVDDIDSSMNILITMGIDGIYTKGLQNDIYSGKEMISYLQSAYGEHLEITAVWDDNQKEKINQFIKETGIYRIQCICLKQNIEPTTHSYAGIDWEMVEAIIEEVEDDVYDFEII